MKTTLIALSYAFCWGIGLTLAKIALEEISATTLLIIQLLSSVLFLYILCYIKERKLPLSLQDLQQGIAGIFEPALAYMVGTLGLALTTASNATLIGSTEVVLTVLFAAVFLGEELTWKKLMLASLSFAGVFFLLSTDIQGTLKSSLFGDLLVLLGTVFAVVYVLVSKAQISAVSPLELTASQQLVGLITTVFCFGGFSLFIPASEVNATGISPQFWLLAIASGILQYALAFLLYLTVLQSTPVSHAAFYIALIPVFGVASAMILIGEQPNVLQWIGAVLIITSSYFANQLQNS
jgi:drug/metabolite transporter (DMT)-like permease